MKPAIIQNISMTVISRTQRQSLTHQHTDGY